MRCLASALVLSVDLSHSLTYVVCAVALQFPEGLLLFACTIADILEQSVS